MHGRKEAGCHKAVPDVREQEATLKHPSVGMALAFTFSGYTPCPQALSLHKQWILNIISMFHFENICSTILAIHIKLQHR